MGEPAIDYATPGGRDPALARLFRVWWAIGAVAGVSILFLLLAPVLNSNTGGPAPRVRCASNLRQIGQGIMLYANHHQGKWPDTLDELIVKADLNPEVFVCPSSGDSAAPGATPQEMATNLSKPGHLSFVYLGKGLKNPVHPDRIVAHELLGNHDGMNVLYADGHVEWFGDAQAKQILADLAAGKNPPSIAPATP